MSAYGSDVFAYDFEAALAAAKSGRSSTGAALHPKDCGQCADCREALADYAPFAEPVNVRDERAFWDAFAKGTFRETTYGFGFASKTTPASKVLAPGAPTREQLARHADKFARGTAAQQRAHRDAVDEVAKLYGIAPASAGTSRAVALYRDGYTVAEIVRQTGRSERAIKAEIRRDETSRKAA